MIACINCGRALKNPESMERGFGPVCWAKAQAKKAGKETELINGVYTGGDIILSRENGYVKTNVPHAIVRHSPAGFDWGYGGSGPSDLALNVLFAVTNDREIADRYYMQFKWDFIAKLPFEGGVIRRDEILDWLKERERRHAVG